MQCLASDPGNFPSLKETIGALAILDCSQYSNRFLQRRIDVRLRVTGTGTYVEYARLLERSGEEREKLRKELTIHITGFFRDAAMWGAFMRRVIPRLAESRRQQRAINIWSAGSSTGEEALSIAICLNEALGGTMRGLSVRIVGVDLDADTVHRAREGVYEEAQFRELPAEYRQKYFERAGEGLYMPSRVLTSLITFRQGNIIAEKKPAGLDAIFCRNTVIYFDLATKARLYEEFYRSLAKGGFLVLGKTELLQGEARNLFKIFDVKERIYIKE